MIIELIPLSDDIRERFITDMQEAFSYGAKAYMNDSDEEVLPRSHVLRSLNEKGAYAYCAISDDRLVGGAILCIDEANRYGELAFLYVKYGIQSRGVGKQIWDSIERKYPDIKVWKTCTPYFEKRNIHFYLEKCGFFITHLYDRSFPNPHCPNDEYEEDGGMFEFEKIIK